MSKFQIEGLEQFRLRLQSIGEASPEVSARMAGAVGEHIKSKMVQEHLNGQNIGRVDHALIDSWTVRQFETPTPGAVLSSDSPYARAQEFGIVRDVSVKAHTRRRPFAAAGLTQRTYRAAPPSQRRKFTAARTAFQESSAGAFVVEIKEHSRKMNLSPRYFLRDAIENSRRDWREIMLHVWRSSFAE